MQLLILCCRCRAYHEEWCKGLVLKHLRGDAMCGRQGWKRKRATAAQVLMLCSTHPPGRTLA